MYILHFIHFLNICDMLLVYIVTLCWEMKFWYLC